jgi:hypothetical protein
LPCTPCFHRPGRWLVGVVEQPQDFRFVWIKHIGRQYEYTEKTAIANLPDGPIRGDNTGRGGLPYEGDVVRFETHEGYDAPRGASV